MADQQGAETECPPGPSPDRGSKPVGDSAGTRDGHMPPVPPVLLQLLLGVVRNNSQGGGYRLASRVFYVDPELLRLSDPDIGPLDVLWSHLCYETGSKQWPTIFLECCLSLFKCDQLATVLVSNWRAIESFCSEDQVLASVQKYQDLLNQNSLAIVSKKLSEGYDHRSAAVQQDLTSIFSSQAQ